MRILGLKSKTMDKSKGMTPANKFKIGDPVLIHISEKELEIVEYIRLDKYYMSSHFDYLYRYYDDIDMSSHYAFDEKYMACNLIETKITSYGGVRDWYNAEISKLQKHIDYELCHAPVQKRDDLAIRLEQTRKERVETLNDFHKKFNVPKRVTFYGLMGVIDGRGRPILFPEFFLRPTKNNE